jgi:hypothetical protein
MYRVSGYFRDHTVVRYFTDQYDAIEFKDIVDANYPLKVTFENGDYVDSNSSKTFVDRNSV